MIKLIDINLIENHPNNPRKNLGDLTELADSIRETGILQNLTIVPWFSTITGVGVDDEEQQKEMGYYALIGNRRLAAAKLAGLENLPCVISYMDYKTQLSTMLLENMQRVDLTPYEQAQGFQTMIDLGETFENISQKTGFSETTVRRRVKLLELDQDTLKEVSERQPNLMDYIELEKIKDIENRNEVLKAIGTSDFNYKMKLAIERQKEEEIKEQMLEILINKNLKEITIEDTASKRHMTLIRYRKNELESINELNKDIAYYRVSDYGISFYVDGDGENTLKLISEEEKEEERIAEEKRNKEELRKEKLKEISERSYELRKEFIEGISNTKARKSMDSIIEFCIYAITSISYTDFDDISKILKIEIEEDRAEDKTIEWGDISKEIWKQPEVNLLLVFYNRIDSEMQDYYNWNSYVYQDNERLDEIYKLLEKLGYRMSEEERKLKEGTHELFNNN